MKPEIMTNSGTWFNFLDLHKNQISIYDIANSLSKICRFNGHTDDHYSVAQHSVLASLHIKDQQYAFEALMHDIAEYATGDITSPLKQLLMRDFKPLEKKIERFLFMHFGLPLDLHPSVKEIDNILRVTEERDLFQANKQNWKPPEGVVPLDIVIRPWPHARAKHEFLMRYEELTTLRQKTRFFQIEKPSSSTITAVKG